MKNERDVQRDLAERTTELTYIHDEITDYKVLYYRMQYLKYVFMLLAAYLFNGFMHFSLNSINFFFMATKDISQL